VSIVGFQDFWVAGSRFYYQRDPINAVEQPWIDLGVVQPVNPSLEIEKLELEDSDGGVKKTVDERVTKIDETYDITCANLNLDNLSLLFLADPPEAFSQTKELKAIAHTFFPGRLTKIVDNDAAATPLYGISSISGIYNAPATSQVLTVTDITGKTLTVSGGNAQTELDDGDFLIVHEGDMVNPANARTYTVDGEPPSTTTIDVVEQPAGDESGVTATTRHGAGVFEQDVSWGVYNLERGFVRAIPGAPVPPTTGSAIDFTTKALTGNRLLRPQSFKGEIQGLGILIWGRGNFQEQTVREARISITPSSANVQIDDFSNFVISVKVISDLLAADVAGRLIYFAGNLPTTS